MPSHASLTGADLHEPKGAAAATANKVYVSDGAASGSWKSGAVGAAYGTIRDVSDTSADGETWIVLPFACTVVKVYTVINAAITVADATITVTNNAGSSMGTITIAFTGAAAGDIDSLTPSSNNTFTAGQKIRINSDGGSSTTCSATVTVEFTYT